jgi:hypothetical protein
MKPTAIKALKGSINVTRQNKREPRLSVFEVPAPGPDLTPNQRKAWLELAPCVNALRVMTKADMAAFHLLVDQLAELYGAREDKKCGRITRVTIRRALISDMARFGMTPVDRQRVASIDGESKDELDEFVAPPVKRAG